jgi:hypothetical protein
MHHPSRQFARGLDAKTQRVKNLVAFESSGAPRPAAAEALYLCIVSGQRCRQIQREKRGE